MEVMAFLCQVKLAAGEVLFRRKTRRKQEKYGREKKRTVQQIKTKRRTNSITC